MFPHFIGIGAQKAGTTWLHRNLQAHPQIWMPPVKEIHYFDKKIDERFDVAARLFGRRRTDVRWRREVRGVILAHAWKKPSLRDLIRELNYYARPYNDAWYASLFKPDEGQIAGEITPAYSVLPRERVAHVHGLMPDAKIVFLMRNPIERIWSQTVMSFDRVQRGYAASVPEEDLLRRMGRDGVRLLSNYLRTLETWGSFYAPGRIFVGFLEDVSLFPEELLSRLYGFLGVDPYFDPSLTGRKVHSRSSDTMPTSIAVRLARDHREEIGRLGERFGGYASFWAHCAARLSEEPPPEESIPYPLWGSYLWEEWTDGAGEPRQAQSGPLASFRVAG